MNKLNTLLCVLITTFIFGCNASEGIKPGSRLDSIKVVFLEPLRSHIYEVSPNGGAYYVDWVKVNFNGVCSMIIHPHSDNAYAFPIGCSNDH